MMTNTKVIFTSVLALCVVSTSCVGAAETSPADSAIRQSAAKFVEAYNKGDAKMVAALWTLDGEYAIGGDTVKGREAIAKLYDDFFRAHPGSKMEVKVDSVRMLAPTVAVEQGTASVGGSPNSPTTASEYTAIHVKQGDQWLMASVRESESPSITANADLSELDWLVGDWAASGDEAKVEIHYDWLANKHFLRGETIITAGGKKTPGGTEIIGRDPATGKFISWYFNDDGGHGVGAWDKDGSRWFIATKGKSADGTLTSAVNVLHHADDNVTSWQSINRAIGGVRLPDEKEVVIERVTKGSPKR